MFKKITFSKLNQSGVAHLLYPILGLAVVAVIAGAGFYVYQQNNSGAGGKLKVFKLTVHQKDQPGTSRGKSRACNPKKLTISLTTVRKADKAVATLTAKPKDAKRTSCKPDEITKQWSSIITYTIRVPKKEQNYEYYSYRVSTKDDGIVPQNLTLAKQQYYTWHNDKNEGCYIKSDEFTKYKSEYASNNIDIRLVDGPYPDKTCTDPINR